MGEDEGRAGDVADLAGAGGDVLQCPPAAGEQGELAFAQAAQRPLEGVAGAGIYSRSWPPGGWRTGMWMPIPAPSYPGSERVGRPAAAAAGGQLTIWLSIRMRCRPSLR